MMFLLCLVTLFKMSLFGIIVIFGLAVFIAESNGQCIRIRSGNCGQQQSCSQSCSSCGTSLEDLTSLLTIIRALEDKDKPKSTISNAEEIILQLVNALVYATTHSVGSNNGGGGNGGSGIIVGGNGGNGGNGGSGGSGGTGGVGGTTGGIGGTTGGAGGTTGGTGGTTGGTGGTTGGTGGTTGGMSGSTGGTGGSTGGTGGNAGLVTVNLLPPTNTTLQGYDPVLQLGLGNNNILEVGIGQDSGLVGSLLHELV